MLDFTVSQNPFRFGLQEGIEPHQVTPGTLLTANNVAWQKSGKLGKRPGTTGLPSTGFARGQRIFTRGGELSVIGDSVLKTYATNAGVWTASLGGGTTSDASLQWTRLLDGTSGVQASDVAVNSNGLLTHAWITGDPGVPVAGDRAYFQVSDYPSGAIVTAPTLLSANQPSHVRVIASGAVTIILWTEGANLKCRVGSTTTTLRTDVGSLATFDAVVLGTNFAVAYTKATGIGLYSYSVATTPIQQVASSVTGEASACFAVSIDGSTSDNLWVGYATAAAFRYAVANPTTLAQTLAPTNVDATASLIHHAVGVLRYSSTQAIMGFSCDSNGLPNLYQAGVARTALLGTGAVVANAYRETGYQRLLSKPFFLDGRPYMFVANPLSPTNLNGATVAPQIDSSLIGIEVTTIANPAPHRYSARLDALIAGNWSIGQVGAVSAISTTSVLFSAPVQSTLVPSFVGTRQGVNLVTANAGASLPTDMWRPVNVGQETYLAAGVLQAYDGRQSFDYGFCGPPNLDSTTAASAVGGSMASGNYLYSLVPEYRSLAGLLHRGPPAITKTVAVTGPAGLVTLVGNTLGLSMKTTAAIQSAAPYDPLKVQMAVHRSTVNGSVLQRLTVDPTYNTCYQTAASLLNSFVDTRNDSSTGSGAPPLASRPTMYTEGGILPDYQPPSCLTAAYHVQRLWVLSGDQKTWWYSKSFQDDLGTAPGFSPQFLISFPDAQTAMASMDDKAIFFSATGVKYMLGTGPAPNGQNSDFQAPTTIQSDVGCTNARSVVTTPDGIMFLSDRGLYLLDRGLTLSWIGRPVRDTLAAYPAVTSAVLVAKQNQVRFTCTDAGATVGVTIVYDYVEKQWATWTHTTDGGYGGPIADACMWNGAWTFVTPTGGVFYETTGYLDSGNYVPMTIETAWITAPSSQASPSSGALKFQSVREFALHGYSNTDHDLTVQVGFDTDPSYPQSITFPATSPVTAVGSLDDCVVSIGTRRKCNAIRFRISDATPSAGVLGTGQGPSFDMMALEVGVKRGTGNTPATKRG